ncbi:MAG: LamG-like jellyroll fold domain-containing protein, partial [Saccharospirillum sp.]
MTALRKIIHFIIKGLLVSSLLLTGYSFAETYTLPEDGNTGLFSSCSVSGGNIDCAGSITLSDNDFDEIVLTEAINLSIGGNLTVGNNAELNPANNFLFDIIVGGDVSIGNNALINANLTAGGDINIGNNSDVNGDCTANGGNYESYCTAALPSTFAEYRFDQPDWSGQTGEALDSSGNDRHGTPAGFSQTVDPGQICNAGRLNGSIDYITVEDLSVLQGTSSLSFWIRTTDTGNDIGWQAPAIAGVEQSGGADDIFWGWIDASGHIGITKGNDFDATKSDTAINDGTFRHVVLTRDASDGSYQIFIDGIR